MAARPRANGAAVPASDKPWHAYLTLDLLAHVLSNSIFHPFIAWLIPLCLRSLAYPAHHPYIRNTWIYATAVTIVAILRYLDSILAWGPRREINWDEEVVVITGGSGGLGRVMAEMFSMKGVSVALLDVRPPEGESEALLNAKHYYCDVGNPDAIAEAKACIEKDLGPPTILINNAGVVNSSSLLSLTTPQLNQNITINLLSHFQTIRAFLPAMLQRPHGGHIVTVASVLGKLGTAQLSDYTAAKAGLIAMHASLRAELACSDDEAYEGPGRGSVRTTLVTPGQLSTPLFAGVETPSNFFGPVVSPVELAKAIVEAVERGESGEISLPLYAKWIGILGVLPFSLQRLARWMSGADRAMAGFGKGKEKAG